MSLYQPRLVLLNTEPLKMRIIAAITVSI